MAKDFLPLISYLITSITSAHTADIYVDLLGQRAFSRLGGTGTVDWEKVKNEMAREKEVVDGFSSEEQIAFGPNLNAAPSCGESAASFGALFFGEEGRVQLKNACEGIDALKDVVRDNQPKLIRIDTGSHSYVIEQIASDKPRGNVYQSNIAVYGYKNEKGCTIQDFLKSYKNPVDLVAHLDKVKEVCSSDHPLDKRYALYKELYVTKGFIERNDEQVINKAFKAAHADGKLDGEKKELQIKKITWTTIDKVSEEKAYDNIKRILGYHPELLKELQTIWQR
jgi:hypothetical protein